MGYLETFRCPEGTKNKTTLREARPDSQDQGGQDIKPIGRGFRNITSRDEPTDREARYETI